MIYITSKLYPGSWRLIPPASLGSASKFMILSFDMLSDDYKPVTKIYLAISYIFSSI